MVAQQIRDKVADWLQFVIDRVGEITEGGNPEKFKMGGYVSEWDYTHNCGSCCCIEGWLPVIFPKQVEWPRPGVPPVVKMTGEGFYPARIGIPLKDSAWNDLTINGPREFSIENYMTLPYREIKKIWIKYINSIRAGQLDHKLRIDNE